MWWRRLIAIFGAVALGGAMTSIISGAPQSATSVVDTSGVVPFGARLTDVKYGPANTDLIDIQYPDVAPVGIIVWFHGGGWIAGNRATAFAQDIPRWLIAHGWVLASVEYRLTHVDNVGNTSDSFPAAVNDAQRATQWILRNRRRLRTPDRIVLSGASAGGNIALVAALATQDVSAVADAPPTVSGVLSFVGPTDVTAMYRSYLSLFSKAAAIYGGCDIKEAHDDARRCGEQPGFARLIERAGVAWNLLHAVESGVDVPPTYLVGGSRDSVVDPRIHVAPIVPLWRLAAGDQRFAEADIVAGAGHNLTSAMIDTERLAAWLNRIVSGELAIPSRGAIEQPLRKVRLGRMDARLPQERAIVR